MPFYRLVHRKRPDGVRDDPAEEITTRSAAPAITLEMRASPGGARLLVLAGDHRGKAFPLHDRALLGRGHDCDVRLVESIGVSRHHARLTREPDHTYVLEDLGSRNGTFVNGARAHTAKLRFGDRIQLGVDVALLFTAHDPGEVALAQAARIDAVNRIAASLAHDFNNLLFVVVSSLDHLRSTSECSGSAECIDSIDDALAASREAMDLAKRLLGLSRPSDGSALQTMDVSAVVADVARLVRRTVPSSIAVTVEASPGLFMHADQSALTQALMNLCVNARDAMPDGGRLTIDLRIAKAHELPPVAPSVGSYARLTVRDTGIGMTDAVRARIFEPFFTTKQKGRGTGLGLASTYMTVRNAGGYIDVESTPGEGTTFGVYLPLAPAPEPSG